MLKSTQLLEKKDNGHEKRGNEMFCLSPEVVIFDTLRELKKLMCFSIKTEI